jgi:hypothetical protein
MSDERSRTCLVTADTRLEVEIGNIHFFETKRALRVLLGVQKGKRS